MIEFNLRVTTYTINYTCISSSFVHDPIPKFIMHGQTLFFYL